MPGPVAGSFFYLYLIVDIFSRKIVGWEVHDRESAEHAARLIRQTVWVEDCLARPLVLHADNGSPMKGASMKVTLAKLGIIASYSRPRVRNDTPFSEALFRTCKYRPNWPKRGLPPRPMRRLGSNPSPVGITMSICTARSASSRQIHATPDKTAPRSQVVPCSIQMPVRKTRNAGQEKLATGDQPGRSGSTQTPKTAPLKSETPHETSGQLL